MPHDYATERAWAEQVGRECGALLLEAYGRVTARDKRPFDLVTDADLASQAHFTRRLLQQFPGHALLGEEEGSFDDPDNAWRWIVDPLDGTVNFAHGFPFWCVSIGLAHEGRLVVGVIYDPLRDLLFSASSGQGARVNGREIRVSPTPSLSAGLITSGWPTEFESDSERQIGLLRAFSERTHSIRRTGSTAMNLAMLAQGSCEASYGTAVHPWDVAAGIVLVQEAGGTVTDFFGQPYPIASKPILASNGLVHAECLDRIKRSSPRPSGQTVTPDETTC